MNFKKSLEMENNQLKHGDDFHLICAGDNDQQTNFRSPELKH